MGADTIDRVVVHTKGGMMIVFDADRVTVIRRFNSPVSGTLAEFIEVCERILAEPREA